MPDIPLQDRRAKFFTGDSLSGTTSAWVLEVPLDDWAQDCFMQALNMLCDAENWQQVGEATVQDAVNMFSETVLTRLVP